MKIINIVFIILMLTVIVPTMGFGNKPINTNSGNPPTIYRIYVEDVSNTSALIRTYFNTNGLDTEVWFEWGITTSFGNQSEIYLIGGLAYEYPGYYRLIGLNPNTFYYYRVVARNAKGTTPSETKIFVTTTPDVVMLPVDRITSTSVRVSARINPKGYSTAAYFLWKGAAVPDYNYSTPIHYINSFCKDTIITADLDSLIPNISYHVYARGYNVDIPDVDKESDLKSFTTLIDSTAGGFVNDIFIQDIPYTENSVVVQFGVHTHATYCIDWELGEADLPPIPFIGVMDNRFVDSRENSTCMDLGLLLDIRKYYSSVQIDTYYYQFQPGINGFPLELIWRNLKANYSGSVRLQDPFGGILVDTDMKNQSSDTIYNPFSFLIIIAEGPRSIIWTKQEVISSDSVMLIGKYNPNGISTEAWFEWGKGKNYTYSTSKQILGNGVNDVFFSEVLDSIIPDTTYYFRAVIQNELGTSYGIEYPFQTSTTLSVSNEQQGIHKEFKLYQAYPNPFNPVTAIKYVLPMHSKVTLVIYNVLGQEVAKLVDEIQQAGDHEVEWLASNNPSGVYFYRLLASNPNGKSFMDTKKLLLIK